MKTIIILSSLLFLLTSCGKSSGSKSGTPQVLTEESTASYRYNLTVNGCTTGDRVFNSLAEMCLGLQNNTLNNSCAYSSRESYFKANCPGTFSTFNEHRRPILRLEPRIEPALDMSRNALNENDMKMVLFMNSQNISAQTLVVCSRDKQTAKQVLEMPEMGGMVITKGSRVIFKNDKFNSFSDGSNSRTSLVSVSCQ